MWIDWDFSFILEIKTEIKTEYYHLQQTQKEYWDMVYFMSIYRNQQQNHDEIPLETLKMNIVPQYGFLVISLKINI